jgi:hypothetical protein
MAMTPGFLLMKGRQMDKMTDRELAVRRVEGLLKGKFHDDDEWFGDAEAILARMPVTLSGVAGDVGECDFEALARFAMHDLYREGDSDEQDET